MSTQLFFSVPSAQGNSKVSRRAVSLSPADRNKNTSQHEEEPGVCQTPEQLLMLAFVVTLGIGYSVAKTVGGGQDSEGGISYL